jgi:preprotein translocase subunit SecA
MFGLLKKLVGSKEKKDAKIYQPFVDKIKAVEASLINLSNDELRNKTLQFKAKIKAATSSLETEITDLEKSIAANPAMDFQEKDTIYNRIDKIKKEIDTTIEKVLEEILPEAFAVVKETAKRFAANDFIEVTATDFDKELAAKKGFIEINGDKAKWSTSWDAYGTH